MNLTELIKMKKKELSPDISKSRSSLKRTSDEELTFCGPNKEYWRYTNKTTGKRIYISQKEKAKAEKMALKTYRRYKMKYEVMLYDAICAFEKVFDYDMKSPYEYLDANPGLAKLVLPNINTLNADLKFWESEDYYSDAGYPEALLYKTIKGHRVRSKSEVIIADALYKSGIPYRYEWTRYFRGKKLSPDFTLRDPQTGKIIIWEHAGLMDDPDYVMTLANKLILYAEAGYRLGDNLIITMETREHPLDSSYVQEIIDRFTDIHAKLCARDG